MSKQERIEQALDRLRQNMPDIRAAIVASPDGLPDGLLIAERGAGNAATRLAAMAATALGLGRRIAQTAQAGEFNELVVRGKDGYLAVFAIEGKAVLALTLPEGGNLGLLRIEAENAVKDVLEEL